MTDIVDELLDFTTRDHERGCTGREYVCSCGYDQDIEAAVKKAAAEIERLHAENASLSSRLDIAAQQIGEYIDAFVRQDQEANKLRLSLSEARATGRREGLSEAAKIGYRVCAETRHVTLGDKVEAAIRAAMEKVP